MRGLQDDDYDRVSVCTTLHGSRAGGAASYGGAYQLQYLRGVHSLAHNVCTLDTPDKEHGSRDRLNIGKDGVQV